MSKSNIQHLYISPHPDDETIWMGNSVLKNKNNAHLAFITSGAPSSFSKEFYLSEGVNSQEEFASMREDEAKTVANILGLDKQKVHLLQFDDLQTYKDISPIIQKLTNLVQEQDITHLHSSCYEGNHPDHDVSRFIAWHVAKNTKTFLTEYSNNLVRKDNKTFYTPNQKEFSITAPTTQEQELRIKALIEGYVCQNISTDIYNYNEYSRPVTSNNYNNLKEAKKLRFEGIKIITTTRKDILNAFEKYENEQ